MTRRMAESVDDYHKTSANDHTLGIAEYVLSKTTVRPKLAIICGSGLGGLADQVEGKEVIKYNTIPDFPESTVAGHDGSFVFGMLGNVPTVVMKGRFHSYEGLPACKVALPVRIMRFLGAEVFLVTNAAGGLNPDFNVGDIMMIRDHISIPILAGENPLRGPNDERWGPRFPPLNKAYDKDLPKIFEACAVKLKLDKGLRKGVYCMVGGPCYETVAECRFLRTIGADAVGMSTTHEVTMAAHCGARVMALSLITNKCVMDWDAEQEANHKEVLEVANKRAKDLEALVKEFVNTLFPTKLEKTAGKTLLGRLSSKD